MKKSELYRLQGELAKKEIQEWPEWMRKSITPPREQQEYRAKSHACDEEGSSSEQGS